MTVVKYICFNQIRLCIPQELGIYCETGRMYRVYSAVSGFQIASVLFISVNL
jgi:hypothetical protein